MILILHVSTGRHATVLPPAPSACSPGHLPQAGFPCKLPYSLIVKRLTQEVQTLWLRASFLLPALIAVAPF